MIPLALVTGFLGSGKTTFLQHCVDKLHERRIVYLVNEFSQVDVDGTLLNLPADQLVSIPGGSIFCHCLVTDFIGHLRALVERGNTLLDGAIVEASGIANPQVVARMLRETGLDQHLRLTSVITIVDPDTFADLLETLPNIRAQVEAADIALVNKCDLCGEAQIVATERALREIRGDVHILRTAHCDVDVDPFHPQRTPSDTQPVHTRDGEYALCTDPNFATMAITPRNDLSAGTLADTLAPLADVAYRLKGFITCDGRLHYVDGTRHGITLQPATSDAAEPRLICIYPPAARDQIRTALDRLT